MKPIYMGVDIAGAQNTWACGISTSTDNLEICLPPAIIYIIADCELC